MSRYESIRMAGYVLLLRALRRERVFRDRTNPFDVFSDTEFKLRFRMSKASVNLIINEIRGIIVHTTLRSKSISPEAQMFVFLRFLATGQFYTSVGDLHGVHASTVCRIIKRVGTALASLNHVYINMPLNEVEMDMVKRDFYAIAHFPGIVGAIDCTHIKLVFNVPSQVAGLYINRHMWYSLNVQVICDAQYRIRNIVARWPGSVHDSRIWHNSRISAEFENGRWNGYLLGDGGYPCLPTLLTPLHQPTTPAERRYNRAHIVTRSTVERMFGQWKRRFPGLKYGLRVKLPTVPRLIVAAAVLHNFTVDNRDEPFMDNELDEDMGHIYIGENNRQGNTFRRRLIERVFHN